MNLKKFAAGLLFLSGTCLLVLTGCGPADSGEAPQTESAAPSVKSPARRISMSLA